MQSAACPEVAVQDKVTLLLLYSRLCHEGVHEGSTGDCGSGKKGKSKKAKKKKDGAKKKKKTSKKKTKQDEL